jgi:hypothetical protein
MNANGHQVSLILSRTTLLCINPERRDELLSGGAACGFGGVM